MKTKLLTIGTLQVLLLLSLSVVGSSRAQVVPPHATVAGRTIGEWTAAYNQWGFTQPISQNPFLDTDGSRAANGQSGPVFFVAGGFYTGVQPPRHYAVPEDKYLLIPIIFAELDNIDTFPPLTVEQLRDANAAIINTTTELHVSIDGVPVPDLFAHREMSPVFNFDLPSADNLFTYLYGHPISGRIDPAVADGYWLMLGPLSPGRHVIVFGGSYGAPASYSYERTDVITVVPIPLSQRVGELVSLLADSGLAPHRQQPLRVSLQAAAASFDSGNFIAGVNQLRAFQNKVRAQVQRSDPALALSLIRAADGIIERAAQPRTNQP